MTTRTSKLKAKAKLQLVWENGKRCAICGEKIKNLEDLTIDHIIPLAEGGKNAIENFQLAHTTCNNSKGNLMPKEYEKILKYNRRRIFLMRIRKMIIIW